MQKAVEKIFDSIISDLHQNIDYYKNGQLKDGLDNARVSSSGSQEITFHLDESGYCFQKYSKYGAGVTVRFKFTILAPKANYTLTIKSSDGGGGTYRNIRMNQPRSGLIKTSFWHATNINITIESDIKNTDVTARIDYSY